MIDSPLSSEDLRHLIAPHRSDIGGPITALRIVQQHAGWIDTDAVDAVADVFNLSRAEVRGLVAFYADFRTKPPAEHTLTVCQAEACQAAGSRQLTKSLSDHTGAELGGTSSDGRIGLEPVYCLGLCARAPAMMVDGKLVVEADRVADRVIEELGA
jgi:formate dehydrogenase subunit gamma